MQARWKTNGLSGREEREKKSSKIAGEEEKLRSPMS